MFTLRISTICAQFHELNNEMQRIERWIRKSRIQQIWLNVREEERGICEAGNNEKKSSCLVPGEKGKNRRTEGKSEKETKK